MATVVVRIKKLSGKAAERQFRHDFRLQKVPHADGPKVDVLLPYRDSDNFEPLRNPSREWVEKRVGTPRAWRREQEKLYRERTGRRLRRDAPWVVSGLVGFGRDADPVELAKMRRELYRRAKHFLGKLEIVWGARTRYLVCHLDETKTHFHFALDYVMPFPPFWLLGKKDKDVAKKVRTLRPFLSKRWLSWLQSAAAEAFRMKPGVPKRERCRLARVVAEKFPELGRELLNWIIDVRTHVSKLRERAEGDLRLAQDLKKYLEVEENPFRALATVAAKAPHFFEAEELFEMMSQLEVRDEVKRRVAEKVFEAAKAVEKELANEEDRGRVSGLRSWLQRWLK